MYSIELEIKMMLAAYRWLMAQPDRNPMGYWNYAEIGASLNPPLTDEHSELVVSSLHRMGRVADIPFAVVYGKQASFTENGAADAKKLTEQAESERNKPKSILRSPVKRQSILRKKPKQ